jgi:hypothetical protein
MNLAKKLKTAIFQIESPARGDYPLFFEKVLFFFQDFFADEEHFLFYSEDEIAFLKKKGESVLSEKEQPLPSFCKQFYNKRIEDLFRKEVVNFDQKQAGDGFVEACQLWLRKHERVQLQVSRDMAECLLYEWLLDTHDGMGNAVE